MTPRRATDADGDALRAFLSEAYATNMAMAGSDHAQFSADEIERLLRENEVWVEERDGRIVASVAIELRAHVKRLAVASHLRGGGLGAEMLALAERRGVERGADAVSLLAAENEPELLAWYDRKGYKRYARVTFPVNAPPYTHFIKRYRREG